MFICCIWRGGEINSAQHSNVRAAQCMQCVCSTAMYVLYNVCNVCAAQQCTCCTMYAMCVQHSNVRAVQCMQCTCCTMYAMCVQHSNVCAVQCMQCVCSTAMYVLYNVCNVCAAQQCTCEAGMARQRKLKRHDGSKVNAMAAKTSVKVSLPSLHDMMYPSVGLCVPQAILKDSTFVITIINVMFYYSATLSSVYVSSARRAVCIIRGILALYSENAAETISEGLKSKIFLGGIPPDAPCVNFMHSKYCWNPPVNFFLRPRAV